MLQRNLVRRPGLSRAEVVVLLLIGVLLISLVIPSLQGVRNGGDYQTPNDLKQIILGCQSFQHEHKRLPPAFDKFDKMTVPASVHVYILPYIEQDNVYQLYLKTQGKGEAASAAIPTFLSPSDATLTNLAGAQNFAANLRAFSDKGLNTAFDADMPALAAIEPGSASFRTSFPDGTSNTMAFATKLAECGEGGSRYAAAPDSTFAAFFGQNAAQVPAHPSDVRAAFQLAPRKDECHVAPLMAQSFKPAGIWVALCDGSVRFVSPGVSPRTWNLAVQPNDKMQMGDDW